MKAFFRVLGKGIDILRVVVSRLFFLLLIGFILYTLFSGPGRMQVPESAALVFAPSGNIVETRSQTNFLGMLLGSDVMQSSLLQDMLDALERAETDDRIAMLVLHLDDLRGMSPAHMETLENALQRFRERSGKPVYAYGAYFSQGQYALAAQADTISLHPMGNLMLQGYGGNQLFFRDLLDNLNITMHVFSAGEYKAAAEPYERMELSPEVRADSQLLVDELWGRYISRVAASRGLDESVLLNYANDFHSLIEQAGGNMSRVALEQGLVDDIADQETFRREMAARVGQAEGSFRQIHYRDYVRATASPTLPATNKVAVWVAEGSIVPGSQPGAVIAEDTAIGLIRQARADDAVKALVVRINSPGGGMLASEAIRSELALLQADGKPVVVSMSGTAASGGYWISATADEIWASPTTITGSIGVVGVLPTFENALARMGIGVDGVGTTPLSRGADPLGGLNEQMQSIMNANVENAYDRFVTLVAEGRDLSVDEVEAVAAGRVLTGSRALEAGLVDSLGELPEAVAAAALLANLDEYQRADLSRPQSFSEQLLQQMLENVDPAPALQSLTGLSLSSAVPASVWKPLVEVLVPRTGQPGRLQQLLICEACNLTL